MLPTNNAKAKASNHLSAGGNAVWGSLCKAKIPPRKMPETLAVICAFESICFHVSHNSAYSAA